MRALKILFFTMLIGIVRLVAAEFPVPAEITRDTIQTETRVITGVIARETCAESTVVFDGKEIAVPHYEIVATYYRDVDNVAWVLALKQMADRDYSAALETLVAVDRSLAKISVARRERFVEHLNYQRGMAYYFLRNFAAAENFLSLAAKRFDAIYRWESEYFLARNTENSGDYEKAENRYEQLLSNVYPQMPDAQSSHNDRWIQLAEVGAARTKVFAVCEQNANDAQVKSALDNFLAIAHADDDESALSNLHAELRARRYFAQKEPRFYEEIITNLAEPIRAAAIANDRANLGWMYLLRADTHYEQFDNATDSRYRQNNAELALYDYLRVVIEYPVASADLARAYFRLGKLTESIQAANWQDRALSYYRRATSTAYRKTPTYSAAQNASASLEKQIATRNK